MTLPKMLIIDIFHSNLAFPRESIEFGDSSIAKVADVLGISEVELSTGQLRLQPSNIVALKAVLNIPEPQPGEDWYLGVFTI